MRAMSEIVALRYMTRFACKGGECEDTCCQHWNVSVDEVHYRALERRMAEPAEHARFEAAFALKPEGQRSAESFATIRMTVESAPTSRAAPSCSLLTDDGACSIHRRYGEPALPDVCSFYPRYVSQVGDRVELAGSLSCPEVVRQALIASDGVALVEAEAALLGRAPVVQRPRAEDAGLLDELRGRLWMLLDRREHPLATRLYFATWLADAAAALLADEPAARDALDEELELSTSEAVLAELAAERALHRQPSPEGLLALATRIVRLRSAVRADFAAEIDAVLDSYCAQGVMQREGGALVLEESFAPAWAERVARFDPATLAAVDDWLTSYARNYCFTQLPASPAGLGSHLRELVARVAALRFLTLSGPGLDGDRAALERRFVRVVYLTARLVDHAAEVRASFVAETEAIEGAALLGVLAMV